MMKKMMALMALMILTACDSSQRAERREERRDERYREAMMDYSAGDLGKAVKGFEKTLANDPANQSARFQLACLLQDSAKDFVGAYVCYSEYLRQQPTSDKAQIVRDRLAVCEREVAKLLSSKYGLSSGTEAAMAELEAARKRLSDSEARVTEMEKNISQALARVRALSSERDRLLDVVKGVGTGEAPTDTRAIVREARELLDEDEEGEGGLEIVTKEANEIKAEGKEEDSTSSSLLPPQPAQPVAAQKTEKPAAEKKPSAPQRPKTYVVVEGDTLYGVSKRFYGTATAWKRIRAANKALISADNRLTAGDTLVLP